MADGKGARQPGQSPDATADPGAAKTPARLLARFYLRFHISLLLLWTFSAGLLVTKAMLWAGVHSMLWRYPVTLLVSYGAFFLGVRIWLAYVGADPFGSGRNRGSSLVDNVGSGGFNLGSWRGWLRPSIGVGAGTSAVAEPDRSPGIRFDRRRRIGCGCRSGSRGRHGLVGRE